ncbi:MAG: formylmethanofuran dehydrogenase subunit C [Pirellulales bacterium]|nr:formylmethanofuran dehydrogenase subunit C [Pirellulales bacterium]
MPLTLTYQAETSVPVEIEGLTPTWARGKTLAQIGQFEIFHGNERLPLAEMFSLGGSADDLRFDFHGDLTGVHWIGAEMADGEVHIHGPGGRHIGSQMSGGTIHVHGDARGWVGAEMQGGFIHVHGSAGHLVGAAYRGSEKGMTGGTILVDGHVGNEVGLTMRRGMIAVGGRAGDMLGFNMIAGTVLVFGECGIRPGAGMRRGTLGLFGPNPPAILPSFRFACTARPQVLPVMFNELRRQGFTIDDELLTAECDVFNGDLVALGRGEILVRSAAAM